MVADIMSPDEQILQLHSVIGKQQTTIHGLQTKLNSVLSFQGTDDPTAITPLDLDSNDHITEVSAQTTTVVSAEDENLMPAWTDILKKQIKLPPHRLITSFQQAILAAVFNAQQD